MSTAPQRCKPCQPPACPSALALPPLPQEYQELERKKAEAEERVSYIFSRKKAVTQGAQRW